MDVKNLEKLISKESSILRIGFSSGRLRLVLKEDIVCIECESSLLASLVKSNVNLYTLLNKLKKHNKYLSDIHIEVRKADRIHTINVDSKSNLVVVSENIFAIEASKSLLKDNSLHGVVIYGESGLGKTTMCNYLKKFFEFEGKKVFSINSINFVSWFVQSSYNKKLDKFRQEILSFDFLILEDIHNLFGKEKTQIELAYLLDCMQLESKKAILTSTKNPFTNKFLNEILQSKIDSFIPCEIQAYSRESIFEIVKNLKFAENISDELLKKVCFDGPKNIRQILGILKNLELSSRFSNGQLNLDKIIKRFTPSKEVQNIDDQISSIIQTVASMYNLTPENILTTSKSRVSVKAKETLILLLKQKTDLSFKEISKIVGFKDHSSVVKAYLRAKSDSTSKQNKIGN